MAMGLALGALAVAACGATSVEEEVEENQPPPIAPSVTGVTNDPDIQAFLRDFVAIRGAIDSATSSAYMDTYYATVNHAGEMDATEGGELLKQELPTLTSEVAKENDAARAAVQATEVETEYGRAYRQMMIDTTAMNARHFEDLHERLAKGNSAWRTLANWGEATNPEIDAANQRFETFVEDLPPDYREAFYKAADVSGYDIPEDS
jgi:hypothetical protein